LEREPYRSHFTGHVIVFSVCFSILSAALLLSPVKTGDHHLSILSVPIPDTCAFKNLTGIPCPGCGLTRSIVAAAHGEIRESILHHRLGLLTLFYIFLQFVYRAGMILAPASAAGLFGEAKHLDRGVVILGALYMLNWLLTLLV